MKRWKVMLRTGVPAADQEWPRRFWTKWGAARCVRRSENDPMVAAKLGWRWQVEREEA